MMLRGHLASGELLRVLFNPCFRRSITAAPIRYAEDKDRKKVEGMFSWLKDILRSDDNSQEARPAIDREGTTVLDNPGNNQKTLINYKAEDAGENNASSETPFGKSEPRDYPPTIVDREKTDFSSNQPTVDSKPSTSLNRGESKDASVSDAVRLKSIHPSPLANDLLTLSEKTNQQIRTIVGCTPRNTKPPIREPNMPERRRKDDKKDKKKKKPVIRMEHGVSDEFASNATVAAKNELHDNVDVNFRYQWGIRLPEEVDKRPQIVDGGVQSSVGDTNFSNYHVSSTYDTQAIEAIKDFQLTMSSAKDSGKKTEKTDAKKDVPAEALVKAAEANAAAKDSKEKAIAEDAKKVLNARPAPVKENPVVDEEYNIPSNSNFDAELSAWKDLVLKSKVPDDPSKGEFLDTDGGTNTKMLSIRPEAPQPRLDVRAVPASSGEADKDDEEEPEVTREFKGAAKSAEPKRPVSSDVQKLDSKKLHTGVFCFLRRMRNDRLDSFEGKSHSREASKVQDPISPGYGDGNLGYSTSADSSWGRIGQSASKGGGDHSRQRNSPAERSSVDVAENSTANETMSAARQRQQQVTEYRRQEESDMDADFAERVDTIAEKDMEVSLSHGQPDDQDARESGRSVVAHRDTRRYEADDHVRTAPEDHRGNVEYSQYEDDFYPGYDSMSLEPSAEKSASEKGQARQEEPSTNEGRQTSMNENSETYARGDEPSDKSAVEGNYVKIPGDPYPYSKEHFNKWILPNEDIQIGAGGGYEKENTLIERQYPNTIGNPTGAVGLSNPSSAMSLSTPANGGPPIESIQPDSGGSEHDDSKKVFKRDRDPGGHSDMTEPDLQMPSRGNRLVQQGKVVNLTLGEKQGDEDGMHALRIEQLISVSKEEIQNIYEQKNYVYLRPEELKNLRLISRPKPEDTAPRTTIEKPESNKTKK